MTQKRKLDEVHALQIAALEIALMIDCHFSEQPEWETPRGGVKLHTKIPREIKEGSEASVYVFPILWPKGDNINITFRFAETGDWRPVKGRINNLAQGCGMGTFAIRFQVPPGRNEPHYQLEVIIPGKYGIKQGKIKNYRMGKGERA